MYHGKRTKIKKYRKFPVLLASLVILLTATYATTTAFLTTGTNTVDNTFVPAQVPNSVVETFENDVKTDVKIKNDGNVEAYIRAMVVVNWEFEGLGNVAPIPPKVDTDYTISWTMTDWIKGEDGFFYYTKPVAPGDTTGQLFTDCKVVAGNTPVGQQLNVQILSQSIQAEPETAVKEAWKNVSVSSDKTLTVN